MTTPTGLFDKRFIGRDLRAGVVVFFIAVPLCLGIAIASGAPPISGLIAGMVGGVVVTLVSGSSLSVSGPAAGLTVIVLGAIEQFGYEGLLFATLIAGGLQLLLGVVKFGVISSYVPNGVIKGMLAAIGLILIGTQIPLALGHGTGGEASISTPGALIDGIEPLALIITGIGLAILVLFETPMIKNNAVLRNLPGPLLVVVIGIALSVGVEAVGSSLALREAAHVQLPGLNGPMDLLGALQLPDFSLWLTPGIYLTALTIALVASLETLLCIEAVDNMDPMGRASPRNRELTAQGMGNMVCGAIGGIPVTSVIVRSSANLQFGGRTRLASLTHGILLIVSVAFLAFALEQIPLACLAAILLHTGYKLAKPALVSEQFRRGWYAFIPFMVTIGAILVTDLLVGVLIGMMVSTYFLVQANYQSALTFTKSGDHNLLRLNTQVSFLNRQEMRDYLALVPNGGYLIVDAWDAQFIDPDIREDLDHFAERAHERDITVEFKHYTTEEDERSEQEAAEMSKAAPQTT